MYGACIGLHDPSVFEAKNAKYEDAALSVKQGESYWMKFDYKVLSVDIKSTFPSAVSFYIGTCAENSVHKDRQIFLRDLNLVDTPTDGWKTFSTYVKIPELKTESNRLSIFIVGYGELLIDNIKIMQLNNAVVFDTDGADVIEPLRGNVGQTVTLPKEPTRESVIIPMAKAFGVRVITTVLTKEIAKSIEHLHADVVVHTDEMDIVEVLKQQLEEGHGVDVAIDCLGGEIMGKCLPYLTHGARWIMIASMAGPKTEIDLVNIFKRNVRIIGSTLRSRTPQVKAEILASLVRDVWPKVAAGEVKPTIYKTLPITEAEAAHDILYRGENVGKVVLTVGN